MIKIMDVNYLTEKEASMRYGYSVSWFSKSRSLDTGPKFVQLSKNGRVLYPLLSTDEWFKDKLKFLE